MKIQIINLSQKRKGLSILYLWQGKALCNGNEYVWQFQ